MKPILFNTEMVRAILDGRKTVTRRVIDVPQGFKFLGWNMDSGDHIQYGECTFISDNGITQIIRKPKYKINDVLYIRETFMEHYTYFISNCLPNPPILDKANFSDNEGLMGCGVDRWKPSIHMPKAYARLFLRVTDVRIERLQDITEYQAKAEGCYLPCYEVKTGKENSDNIALFKIIWNSTIHKSKMDQYGWNANPWVFVYEFEKISKEAAMEEENEI